MLKSLVFALAFVPTAILAQGAPAIPACALTCVTSSFAGTPCTSVANLTCICSDTTFQAAFLGCQMRTCSAAELTSAIAFGTSQCAALGITLPPLPSNLIGNSTSAASTASATGSAVATATSAASSAASSAARSSTAAGSSSAASAASSTATAAPRSDAQSLAFGGLAGSIALGLALLV